MGSIPGTQSREAKGSHEIINLPVQLAANYQWLTKPSPRPPPSSPTPEIINHLQKELDDLKTDQARLLAASETWIAAFNEKLSARLLELDNLYQQQAASTYQQTQKISALQNSLDILNQQQAQSESQQAQNVNTLVNLGQKQAQEMSSVQEALNNLSAGASSFEAFVRENLLRLATTDKDLNGRIVVLSNNLTKHDEQLNNLAQTSDATVAALAANKTTLQAAVNDLQAQLNTLGVRAGEVDSKLAAHDAEAALVKTTINTLNDNMQAVDNDLFLRIDNTDSLLDSLYVSAKVSVPAANIFVPLPIAHSTGVIIFTIYTLNFGQERFEFTLTFNKVKYTGYFFGLNVSLSNTTESRFQLGPVTTTNPSNYYHTLYMNTVSFRFYFGINPAGGYLTVSANEPCGVLVKSLGVN